MGRQIHIATTKADEKLFLNFLKGTANVRILESSANSPEELWVEDFAPKLTGHWTYSIWNTNFPFEFEYNRTIESVIPRHYYIENSGAAPVIEFTRSNVRSRKYGRIYWSKDFSAPEGLSYDVDEFSQWFDSIVEWIRKNAAGKLKEPWTTYFLPDAWDKHLRQ